LNLSLFLSLSRCETPLSEPNELPFHLIFSSDLSRRSRGTLEGRATDWNLPLDVFQPSVFSARGEPNVAACSLSLSLSLSSLEFHFRYRTNALRSGAFFNSQRRRSVGACSLIKAHFSRGDSLHVRHTFRTRPGNC